MTAINQLYYILEDIVNNQSPISTEKTFKNWIQMYFSNKDLTMRDIFLTKPNQTIEEEEEEEEEERKKNEEAYSKCHDHYINFRAQFGSNAFHVNFYFLDSLRKLLSYLLPLIPTNVFLQSSIVYLEMIIKSIEICNANYPTKYDIPNQSNLQMQKCASALFSLLADNVMILNIFDRLINEAHLWDVEKMKFEISSILNDICVSDNLYWLQILYGPLKNPIEAMSVHRMYIRNQKEKLFHLRYDKCYKIYELDVNFLIWDSIRYFDKMFDQINIKLLTQNQRQIYYYVKNFLSDIVKKSEMVWSDCFQQKLDSYFVLTNQQQ